MNGGTGGNGDPGALELGPASGGANEGGGGAGGPGGAFDQPGGRPGTDGDRGGGGGGGAAGFIVIYRATANIGDGVIVSPPVTAAP